MHASASEPALPSSAGGSHLQVAKPPVARGLLAKWLLAQKKTLSDPPEGYEVRRGQLDDGPLLIHRETRISAWPHLLRLGESLQGQYFVLFFYCRKAHLKQALTAGSSANLWHFLRSVGRGHRPGQVLLSDRGPDGWKGQPWNRTFWSGRLLLPKARILHNALHDTSKFEFSGNTPADWCMALRVPNEWVREGGGGWWNVEPDELPATDLNLDERLFAAVQNNEPANVKQLVTQNADANARNRTGWQPLMRAASAGYVQCAAELVYCRAEVNARNSFGGTALGLAVVGGQTEVLWVLVRARAELNERDQWSETALHLAAKAGHAESALALVACHADVWARNIYGDLAYDLAKARGFRDLADQLRERMDAVPVGVELPYPLPRDAAQLTALTAP